jgi:hypothetical protein
MHPPMGRQLTQLQRLTTPHLRRQYAKVFGSSPPRLGAPRRQEVRANGWEHSPVDPFQRFVQPGRAGAGKGCNFP